MGILKTDQNIYSRTYVEEIRERVQPIIQNVIEPNAEAIDREGKFPRENLLALAKEGWNSDVCSSDQIGRAHV